MGEKIEGTEKNTQQAHERKVERKTNFYVRSGEIRDQKGDVLKSAEIVLLYKEALLNTNDLDPALHSSVVSLLQEFEDVFPDEVPDGDTNHANNVTKPDTKSGNNNPRSFKLDGNRNPLLSEARTLVW